MRRRLEPHLVSSKSYGNMYILDQIGKEVKLHAILEDVFGEEASVVLGLAEYLVDSGQPMEYMEDWGAEQVLFSARALNGRRRISELLAKITPDERGRFYRCWGGHLPSREYAALDITSISSYSQLMEDEEWGYNRDHDKLPQENLCLLFGEDAKLPLYQKGYSGSITDVAILRTTLKEVTALLPNRPVRAVTDKGFWSRSDMLDMLDRRRPVEFLAAAGFVESFVCDQVEAVRDVIDDASNALSERQGVVYGLHRVRLYEKGYPRVHVLVYHNLVLETTRRAQLQAMANELCEVVRTKKRIPAKRRNTISKHLVLQKSRFTQSGYDAKIKDDVIRDDLKHCGWLVLVSSKTMSTEQALGYYRHKDVVEKGFDEMKSLLDLRRLRVHSDIRAENILFIGFIAQILAGEMYNRMNDSGLIKQYTLRKVLRIMGRLRLGEIGEEQILSPITKTQRDILRALKLPPPPLIDTP